jgi:exonuclease III
MSKQNCCVGMVNLLACLLIACNGSNEIIQVAEEEFDEIKVMTHNVLYTTSNDATLQVLRETDADIIGLQEVSTSRLIDLAQKLHYHFHSFSKTTANLNDEDTGILSRFPITRFFENGVVVRVNPKLELAVFTVHLAPYPYEPYDFRDGVITTAEAAVASASKLRLPALEPVLEEINNARNDGIPVFLTGDFNEPSHFDWTTQTASSNMHFNKVVEWPVSKMITQSGLIDAYRSRFPNAANFPGVTWTTIESPDEVYDRIDMVYQTDEQAFTLKDVRLVGGVGDIAGILVKDYPSDHYAVIATYKLEP